MAQAVQAESKSKSKRSQKAEARSQKPEGRRQETEVRMNAAMERGGEPGMITAIHGLGLYPDFQIEIEIGIETSKAEIVLDADFD